MKAEEERKEQAKLKLVEDARIAKEKREAAEKANKERLEQHERKLLADLKAKYEDGNR